MKKTVNRIKSFIHERLSNKVLIIVFFVFAVLIYFPVGLASMSSNKVKLGESYYYLSKEVEKSQINYVDLCSFPKESTFTETKSAFTKMEFDLNFSWDHNHLNFLSLKNDKGEYSNFNFSFDGDDSVAYTSTLISNFKIRSGIRNNKMYDLPLTIMFPEIYPNWNNYNLKNIDSPSYITDSIAAKILFLTMGKEPYELKRDDYKSLLGKTVQCFDDYGESHVYCINNIIISNDNDSDIGDVALSTLLGDYMIVGNNNDNDLFNKYGYCCEDLTKVDQYSIRKYKNFAHVLNSDEVSIYVYKNTWTKWNECDQTLFQTDNYYSTVDLVVILTVFVSVVSSLSLVALVDFSSLSQQKKRLFFLINMLLSSAFFLTIVIVYGFNIQNYLFCLVFNSFICLSVLFHFIFSQFAFWKGVKVVHDKKS